MNDVKYTNANEKRLICAIQHEVDALENGWIGNQTLVDLAVKLGLDCWPLTLKIYGCPVIVAKDFIPFNPGCKPLTGYANSMLGSFTYPRAVTPCSILVNNGEVIHGSSCHSFLGKPETVLYVLKDGTVGVKRAMYSTELPKNVEKAVGGLGLLHGYSPISEGFTGKYADVLRCTDHTVLAYKNKMWYGVFFNNMTGQAVNTLCDQKFKFDLAIMLDGGGLAAINGDESFAKINTKTKQGYAIQFV